MLSDADVKRLLEAEANIRRIKAEQERARCTQVYYGCDVPGKIREQYARPFCEYCILKKYDKIYREERPRFEGCRGIYALPDGDAPNKVYLGLDRSEELFRLFAGTHAFRSLKNYDELSRRIKHGDYITDLALAEEYYGYFSTLDEYDLVYTASTAFEGAVPEGFGFTGYDICYRPLIYGAFSMICDCMFICRWHGCDDDGALFAEDFAKLNDNGLFDDFEDAYAYMTKYLSEDWTELGDYFIVKVYLRK